VTNRVTCPPSTSRRTSRQGPAPPPTTPRSLNTWYINIQYINIQYINICTMYQYTIYQYTTSPQQETITPGLIWVQCYFSASVV
jgi:hypothetical protein